MKQKLNSFFRNNHLIKLASLNSISIVIRVLTGFITSKFIAIFVGPSGMALVGNLRDFMTSAQAFSTLGLYNGIIKYVAEFKSNVRELSKTVSTTFYLLIISSLIVGTYSFFQAQYLNDTLFTNEHNYVHIIKILAVALPFYSMKTFVFAVLNGLSKQKKLLFITILSQILGVIINVLLIWKFQLSGALIHIAAVEIVLCLITLFSVSKFWKATSFISLKKINLKSIKNLSAFSIMALFSATVLPMISVLIRNHIIDNLGESSAGYWVAMGRISNYYLMFISSLMTLYILPRFAAIYTHFEFRKEVWNFYKTIVPIFALGLLIIYLCRHLIIKVIFTKEFIHVEELFLWQLLGDFLKVLSMVVSYQFLAKKMLWHYMLSEIFSVILLYFASIYLIDVFGLKGVVIAHFIDYLLYYILLLAIFYKPLFGKQKED
ncbi:O-antigen translocase [Mangrovimonas xylaniphaga]|uniref:O-antigen translocase n=1 Tax=Mangrovimonas xylaniphaga TaxID=1645915 RepID=UPI0006B5DE18|nr:O-antigen translocase [Mangrovimonas xylaniphaga]